PENAASRYDLSFAVPEKKVPLQPEGPFHGGASSEATNWACATACTAPGSCHRPAMVAAPPASLVSSPGSSPAAQPVSARAIDRLEKDKHGMTRLMIPSLAKFVITNVPILG